MTHPGEVDWEAIYRLLMHGRPRLRPWEISQLTIPMLILALDQDLEDLNHQRPPPGAIELREGEEEEYARRWRQQTVADRLKQAREKWN